MYLDDCFILLIYVGVYTHKFPRPHSKGALYEAYFKAIIVCIHAYDMWLSRDAWGVKSTRRTVVEGHRGLTSLSENGTN